MDGDASWADLLAAWAIPNALIEQAPESPFFFDPAVFIAAADNAVERREDTPSDAAARAALGRNGSVIDVGVGAGAASLRLRPTEIVGVDPSMELLDAFVERAQRLGIRASVVRGEWPSAASDTSIGDVVTCHHVLYNATNLAAFVEALTEHARRRVVVEITARHPMEWLAPYWKALWGLSQPTRPTADDAVRALTQLGYDVDVRRWTRRIQMIGETGDDAIARIARRLCLPASRTHELAAIVREHPPPEDRDVVTLSWAGHDWAGHS
jgi:SAM-dependent methyltransferase